MDSRSPETFPHEVVINGWPLLPLRPNMSDNKETEIVRIDLTPDQKEKVKAATDQSADAIELTVQELEARIAPIMYS